jgi:trk system potassium uptake protein TrkA/voltage-gated potassium channel
MNDLWKSPIRNLIGGVIFVLTVGGLAATAYVVNGWRLGDAIYMVIITVFTVGYGEVRQVNTPQLRAITEVLVVLGCTGMIFLTGALVQLITFSGLQQMFGQKRMKNQIDSLAGHIVICGFGRIGQILTRELTAGNTRFVVIENDETRVSQAHERGYLCIMGDATDEAVLINAGVERARVLATVLPEDAANVFITLSARSLNPKIEIIARGETPSTETKLRQAGANQVVLPAHIGAERVAEIILYPTTAALLRQGERMHAFEQDLSRLGLTLETVVVEDSSRYAWRTISEIETVGLRNSLIISVSRTDGSTEQPTPNLRVMPGDGLTLLRRGESG